MSPHASLTRLKFARIKSDGVTGTLVLLRPGTFGPLTSSWRPTKS